MSGKQRGLLRMIFKTFFESITPTFTRRKLMGEDYFGTKYYEVPVSHTSRHKRPSRYFQSVNNDFEQEIPAEWEAWLRYRRKEPPTLEEIETNYKLAVIKKLKAAEKEIANKEKANLKENVTHVKKRGYESFPVYEEYSIAIKNDILKRKSKS